MAGTQLRGWYPDPSGAPRQRYWDGQQWTGHAPARPTLTAAGLWLALGVIAVVALLFAGCSAMIAAGSKPHAGTDTDRFRGLTGVPGSLVHDGDFEFVVTGTPTDWRGAPRPRGEWLVATTTVRNIDDESQEFVINNQKLIDSDGHAYAADVAAAVAMNATSMVITVDPGANITVRLPFDVPEGTLPAAVELHDSVFSDGVQVRVAQPSASSRP
ncbi:DUF4352 domain-containing protein [Mycobacterium sp. NPDC048908]|uniref:DUF4352 domain-containing protein n=1 Tax=Mycobacterium sp. NPDC048908 TaxID=3364292 RepID=UPI003721003C